MNHERALTARARTRSSSQESTRAGVDAVTRMSINAMAGVGAIIGLWAAATLISAMVIHGPVGLITGWFGAVTGIG